MNRAAAEPIKSRKLEVLALLLTGNPEICLDIKHQVCIVGNPFASICCPCDFVALPRNLIASLPHRWCAVVWVTFVASPQEIEGKPLQPVELGVDTDLEALAERAGGSPEARVIRYERGRGQ